MTKPGPDLRNLSEDLRAECQALDTLVSGLNDSQWQTATIFYGWTVRDQIMHLLHTDIMAVTAVKDPESFAAMLREKRAKEAQGVELSQQVRERYRDLAHKDVLDLWRKGYGVMCDLFAEQSPKARAPWISNEMSLPSFTSARQMECWAHGQDIYDLFRVRRANTDRIRNIAELGVRTFGFSFTIHKQTPPTAAPLVHLTSPSGAVWTWNEVNSESSLRGTAEDFCLVVTQRRNVRDTDLVATGDAARRWMDVAQCFGGESGMPAPGVRAVTY